MYFKQFASVAPAFVVARLDEVVGYVYGNRHEWKRALELYKDVRDLALKTEKSDFELPGNAASVEATLLPVTKRIATLKMEAETSAYKASRYEPYVKIGDIYATALSEPDSAIRYWRLAMSLTNNTTSKLELANKIADLFLFSKGEADSAARYYGFWTWAAPEQRTVWKPDWTTADTIVWDQRTFINAFRGARGAIVCRFYGGHGPQSSDRGFRRWEKGWPDFAGYRIRPGETLYSISRAIYGVPLYWRVLFKRNGDLLSHPDSIRAGQTIRIAVKRELFQTDPILLHFMRGDSAVVSHDYGAALASYGKGLELLSEESPFGPESLRSLAKLARSLKKHARDWGSADWSHDFSRFVSQVAFSDLARVVAFRNELKFAADSALIAKTCFNLGRLYLRHNAVSLASRYFERCMRTGAAGSLADDANFYVIDINYLRKNEHLAAARELEAAYKRWAEGDFRIAFLYNAALRYDYAGKLESALRCYRTVADDSTAPLDLRFASLFNTALLQEFRLNNRQKAEELLQKLVQLAQSEQLAPKLNSCPDCWEYLWRARRRLAH